MRTSIACLTILGLLTGCGSLPAARPVLSSSVLHGVTRPGRTAFHADLAAATDPARGTTPGAVAATLDLTFRDAERFEYRLVVWNAATTYTTISLREAGRPGASVELATGLEVRGAYAQVRGTGVLDERADGATLLERLRGATSTFAVVISGVGGAAALQGSLE